jgi:hypothetical protein
MGASGNRFGTRLGVASRFSGRYYWCGYEDQGHLQNELQGEKLIEDNR